jgi:16S rRNA U516 pseudouridylate synthase RsuA-like enzyme
MLEALDFKVVELTRLSEGKLVLKNIKIGEYKKIKKSDII